MCSQVGNHWFLCSPRSSLSISNIPHGALGSEILFTQKSFGQPFLYEPLYRPLTSCSRRLVSSTMDSKRMILANPSPVLEGLEPTFGEGEPRKQLFAIPHSPFLPLSRALHSLTYLSILLLQIPLPLLCKVGCICVLTSDQPGFKFCSLLFLAR